MHVALFSAKAAKLPYHAATATVRERKRNLRYVANILILSDPANPENDGTVKLFRFGKKIFDKIMDSMQPQFPDETPINPFDMWKGADFTLKIRKVEGYPNYDTSSFKSPSAIKGDDDKLEEILERLVSIRKTINSFKY